MKIIFALITPAVIAAAMSLSAASVVDQTPPGPPLPKSTVLWGDRFFYERSGLASWLSARGVSYGEWARKHPAAAARQRRLGRAASRG